MDRKERLSNPLARKLAAFVELDDADLKAIDTMCERSTRIPAGRRLISEGDPPDVVRVLLEGWACRHKDLADGRRQIIALLLPGDFCDTQIFILKQMDHSISLLSDARVAHVSQSMIVAITENYPRIARAFWWSTLVDEAISREWLVSVGSRGALQGLAHLFLEMLLRLRQVGLTEDNGFVMPMTQSQLAEALGLTTVHLNRTLQQLRNDGLVSLKGRRLAILDIAGLTALADFSRNYLHFDR